jgi:hypothetical protein
VRDVRYFGHAVLFTSSFCSKESTSSVINLSDLFNWVMPVVVDLEESMFHLIVHIGSADTVEECSFIPVFYTQHSSFD